MSGSKRKYSDFKGKQSHHYQKFEGDAAIVFFLLPELFHLTPKEARNILNKNKRDVERVSNFINQLDGRQIALIVDNKIRIKMVTKYLKDPLLLSKFTRLLDLIPFWSKLYVKEQKAFKKIPPHALRVADSYCPYILLHFGISFQTCNKMFEYKEYTATTEMKRYSFILSHLIRAHNDGQHCIKNKFNLTDRINDINLYDGYRPDKEALKNPLEKAHYYDNNIHFDKELDCVYLAHNYEAEIKLPLLLQKYI